jgi:hypothetical protein
MGTREPIEHSADADNELYIIEAGDTLESIANVKFVGYPEAAQMAWIIGEFQPTPIRDLTLRLQPGSILIIPSPMLVHEIFNEIPEETII